MGLSNYLVLPSFFPHHQSGFRPGGVVKDVYRVFLGFSQVDNVLSSFIVFFLLRF